MRSTAGVPFFSCCAAGGEEAALLAQLQHSAAALLRRLRPDNFPPFAELFMAAVLQARLALETLCQLSGSARQSECRPHIKEAYKAGC
jgi:hypothetical protein